MKRIATVLFLAAVLIPISSANAQFATGNQLLAHCQDEEDAERQAYCYGYSQGVADFFGPLHQQPGGTQCPPAGVNGDQIREVMIRYLEQNPEHLHLTGAVLAMLSITSTWCPDSRVLEWQ